MIFRAAQARDAVALAELAEETFRETYASGSDPDDLEDFVLSSFGEDRQRAELLDPNIVTIVGEVDGAIQCYAQLHLATTPPVEVDADAVRLWRFYVRSTHHGRGVAQELMAAVEDTLRRHSRSVVWLGVYAPNSRAIAFYRKEGFVEAGHHECRFGSQIQDDLVMVRRLGPAPARSVPVEVAPA